MNISENNSTRPYQRVGVSSSSQRGVQGDTASHRNVTWFQRSVQWNRYRESYQKFTEFFSNLRQKFSFSTDHEVSIKKTSGTINPPKRKKTLLRQGYLFSSEELKTVGGRPHYWPRDRTYKLLISNLKKYQHDSKNQTRETIKERLGQLKEEADSYLGELAKIHPQTSEAKNRQHAVDCLLCGINRELEKEALLETTLPGKLREGMKDSYFTPQNEVRSQENFASGAMATVSLITYQDGRKAVFKPVSYTRKMHSPVALQLGIPETSTMDANLAGRAIATWSYDVLLDGNLVPRTGIALHDEKVGTVQEFVVGEPLYREENIPLQDQDITSDIKDIVTDAMFLGDNESGMYHVTPRTHKAYQFFASSNSMHDEQSGDSFRERQTEALSLIGQHQVVISQKQVTAISDVDFTSPLLQRAMANAQILDFLTGQIDRNPGNFIYQKDDQSNWNVQLIDNDLSFPREFQNLSDKKTLQQLGGGPSLTKLPRLIDAEMAQKVLLLESADIYQLCDTHGMTDPERKAAVDRLEVLQEHIRAISAEKVVGGRLVTTWDKTSYRELTQKYEAWPASQEGQQGKPFVHDNYISRSLEDRAQKVQEMKATR